MNPCGQVYSEADCAFAPQRVTYFLKMTVY